MKIEQSITPTFTNELFAAPDKIYKKVQRAIAILKEDPQNNERQLDIKKLAEIDGFRVKIDDYRLIYTIKGNIQTFVTILPRKDIYKKLSIPDEEGLLLVEDIELKQTNAPSIIKGQLPHPLSEELLSSWRISSEHHSSLLSCRTEDDLLEAPLPYPIFSRVVDLLYSKKWSERLSQPQYILQKPTDLDDLVEGNLTSRLLRLDEHQRFISGVALEENHAPIIVKGGPGSGKSTVALYRVKLLVERFPDARIAYTTYTHALSESSRQQLQVLLPEDFEQVRIGTVDSLAIQLLRTVEEVSPTILGPTDPLTIDLFDEILENKPKQLARYSKNYLLSELFDVIETW